MSVASDAGDANLEPLSPPTTLDQALAILHAKHFIISFGGDVFVGEMPEGGGLQLMKVRAAQELYGHWNYPSTPSAVDNGAGKADTGTKPKRVMAFEVWRKSKKRRTYKGSGLYRMDAHAPPGILNLWRGLAIKPKSGGSNKCPTIIEFIYNTCCNGSKENGTWLIRLLAWWIQSTRPAGGGRRAARGKKGIGKNALVQWILGPIVGEAFTSIVTHQRHFTGNFNQHQRDKLLLVFDEAVWKDDPQADAVLKGLITGKRIQIEGKGRDVEEVENHAFLWILSNNPRVISATAEERRYAAFAVSDAHMGPEHQWYWDRLRTKIPEELPYFLGILTNADLSTFNRRDIPRTPALVRQIERNFTVTEAFWHEALVRGWQIDARSGWQDKLDRDRLRTAIYAFADQRGYRLKPTEEEIGQKLREMSTLRVGMKIPLPLVSTQQPKGQDGKRRRLYTVDTLEHHRQAFADYMRSTVDMLFAD